MPEPFERGAQFEIGWNFMSIRHWINAIKTVAMYGEQRSRIDRVASVNKVRACACVPMTATTLQIKIRFIAAK